MDFGVILLLEAQSTRQLTAVDCWNAVGCFHHQNYTKIHENCDASTKNICHIAFLLCFLCTFMPLFHQKQLKIIQNSQNMLPTKSIKIHKIFCHPHFKLFSHTQFCRFFTEIFKNVGPDIVPKMLPQVNRVNCIPPVDCTHSGQGTSVNRTQPQSTAFNRGESSLSPCGWGLSL